MNLLPDILLLVLWALLWGYWGLAATRPEQISRGQSTLSPSRLLHLALFCLSFLLSLSPWLRFGILGARFLPDSPLLMWLGLALTAGGVTFAISARAQLGRYWSGRITIKTDHRLIRSGPYALARHPIYTGITCAMLGTAIALGEWRGVLAFALIFIAYLRKIPMEETVLVEQFGAEYEQYRREVKAILPFLI